MFIRQNLVAYPNKFEAVELYLKLGLYYFILFLVTLSGVGYGLFFSELNFPSYKPEWIEDILNFLKLVWLIPLPYALINFYAFARYPIFMRPRYNGVGNTELKGQLYFRYVTRGLNNRLVINNIFRAQEILRKTLGEDKWVVEVVTDNGLKLVYDGDNLRKIKVPPHYKAPNGTLFKARALHWAMMRSRATNDDWIIHLDEETQFDEDTVRAIYAFAAKEEAAVSEGQQEFAKIGQGVIVYGAGPIINKLTTLADSIRVGDDYGRFRLQFEHGKAIFGIHGSFIVVQNRVEKTIGIDNGPTSSITEDAYFALAAQAKGVGFSFIHAFMYEKSPFSLKDFIKQRRRWFGGLWMCVRSKGIPLRVRIPLTMAMCFWSLSWLCITMVFVNLLYPRSTPLWLEIPGGIAFVCNVFLYLIGFWRAIERRADRRHAVPYFLGQLFLIPLFSIMESAGVIYGILSPPKNFDIVKKQVT